MSKLGIAMIARNAEELMPLALDPIIEYADEVAIVLGGVSTDRTPELAEKYATLPVEEFQGPMDEDGRLMSFAQARNQSFAILERAGIEYAWVVDTDDQWHDPERVRDVLEQASARQFPMVMFPYKYEGGEFMQPRIYEIASGHWEGPCHNYWQMDNRERIALQTDVMWVEQERPEEHAADRRHQNIHISEEWMKEHGDNCRLLLHMAKDLMVDRDLDRAEKALERYFAQYEFTDQPDPEEYYNAWHTRAGIRLIQGRYAEALADAFSALSVRMHGQSWTLASEAAALLSQSNGGHDKPLLELSVFCADQAIKMGRSRNNLHWQSDRLSLDLPLFFKGRSLVGLQRGRDALGWLDLAHSVAPDNQDIATLRQDLCRQMGILE